jgi:hypothetical protein
MNFMVHYEVLNAEKYLEYKANENKFFNYRRLKKADI